MQDFNPHDYFNSDEANAYTEKKRLIAENEARQRAAEERVKQIDEQTRRDQFHFHPLVKAVAAASLIALIALFWLPVVLVCEAYILLSCLFKKREGMSIKKVISRITLYRGIVSVHPLVICRISAY